ncbi:hypothetical protein PSHT_09959 [Puccinia striiformis]|uniref:Uncharacterized protein n=1 Tax=Puccinia striiformis TaxID=27350 RepID=A0A2S4VD74_9BASI|nr:hypothetical protein PSHT_09959 [Puccinia striiformis]
MTWFVKWSFQFVRGPCAYSSTSPDYPEDDFPDKPVKSPHFIRRSISIGHQANHLDTPAYISITIAALTLRQARVSMDHLLSDLELVVETLATFSASC